jgi:hypothetical protein
LWVFRGKLVVVDGWKRGGGDFWGETTMEWAWRTIRREALSSSGFTRSRYCGRSIVL